MTNKPAKMTEPPSPYPPAVRKRVSWLLKKRARLLAIIAQLEPYVPDKLHRSYTGADCVFAGNQSLADIKALLQATMR